MNLQSTEDFVNQLDRMSRMGKLLMTKLRGTLCQLEPLEVAHAIRDGSIFRLLDQRGLKLEMLSPLDRLELLIEWQDMLDDIKPFYFEIMKSGVTLVADFLMQGLALRTERLCRGSLDDVNGVLDDQLPEALGSD